MHLSGHRWHQQEIAERSIDYGWSVRLETGEGECPATQPVSGEACDSATVQRAARRTSPRPARAATSTSTATSTSPAI